MFLMFDIINVNPFEHRILTRICTLQLTNT